MQTAGAFLRAGSCLQGAGCRGLTVALNPTASTTVADLVKEYPFLLEFLAGYHPRFNMLRSKVMRATMAKVATLEMAAGMAGIATEKLVGDIVRAIQAAPAEGAPASSKVETLRSVILDLHKGVPLEQVKAKFDGTIEGLEEDDIVRMEQQLVNEGMDPAEIQKLCDLHVGVVKDALDRKEERTAPPGHPVHTYMEENKRIAGITSGIGEVLGQLRSDRSPGNFERLRPVLLAKVEALEAVKLHYTRKENQLFPYLEKHDITAPPRVMWGVDDEVRAKLKDLKAAVAGSQVAQVIWRGADLTRVIDDMIYKENRILFPMCLDTFSDGEWIEIRKGEPAIGYAFGGPAAEWPAGTEQGGSHGQT